MQISSAIMQNSVFRHNSQKTWPNLANKVTNTMFSGSRNKLKAIKKNDWVSDGIPIICKLVPPLSKTRFSSITRWIHDIFWPFMWQTLCFYGQWIRLKHLETDLDGKPSPEYVNKSRITPSSFFKHISMNLWPVLVNKVTKLSQLL